MTILFIKDVVLEFITDIVMLLMVEKGTRSGICHSINRHVKVNKKYMKNYDKNQESSYLMYLNPNNLFGWAISQKLNVGGYKWEKNIHKYDEDSIENYEEDSDKGYIIEVDVEYLLNVHGDLPFL